MRRRDEKRLLLWQIPDKQKREIKLSKKKQYIHIIATETFVIHKVKMSRTKHRPITL